MPKRTAAAPAPIETPTPQGEYRRVPLEAIIESSLNPRKHIDEDALRELVESIRLHDVIEPIVVRARPFDDTPGETVYEVVAGARRTRAARLANRVDVPVMIRDVTDAQLLELALQENLHRASMTPLDEARALETLASLDPIYRDDRVLAGKIGRSETYVRDRRKLLRLDAGVQDALEAGAITAKHAERIARLPVDQHAAALEACFSSLLTDADYAALDARTDTAARPIEYASVADRIAARAWTGLAPALVSLKEFDSWADSHAKVDLAAPEIQAQLQPVLDDLVANNSDVDPDDDAAMEDMRRVATATFLQLSEDPGLATRDAADIGVVPYGRWKEITREKDQCDFTQRAAVVHGGSFRLVDVCTESRKCQQHWPKPKKAKGNSSSAKPSWQVEQEKREAERQAWDAVKPRYLAALTAHTKGTRVTAKLVEAATPDHTLREVKRDFGVALSDATIGQVLALSTVRTYEREAFVKDAKALGLKVDKIAVAIKAEQKKAAAAASTSETGSSGAARSGARKKKGTAKK